MEAALFFLVALTASVVGAISGIGGGVIIKPALEAASDMTSKSISFLSGCTVLSMALVSVYISTRQKSTAFEYRRGTLLGIGAAFGGMCGKLAMELVASRLNDQILGKIQAAALSLIMLVLLAYCVCENHIRRKDIQGSMGCMFFGCAMGITSAFLGIGGGPLNLALLRCFFCMDNRKAAVHSLYIIIFSQIASLVLSLMRAHIPLSLLPLLAATMAGGILGGILGRTFSKKVSDRHLNVLYICVLIFVCCMSASNLI